MKTWKNSLILFSGVTEFKTGDKVYSLLCTSSGGYAEYSTVKETFAVKESGYKNFVLESYEH